LIIWISFPRLLKSADNIEGEISRLIVIILNENSRLPLKISLKRRIIGTEIKFYTIEYKIRFIHCPGFSKISHCYFAEYLKFISIIDLVLLFRPN
jgi:hypothetical protein